MIGSKVSKRYAKALFSLGQEDGKFEQYGQELSDFETFFQNNEDFRQVIVNPVFALEDRRKVLQVVLDKSNFSGVVKNFLNLLLDKNRIGAIEAIKAYYSRLTDEVSGIARAEIVTARPLKEETLGKIERSLEGLTSKKIKPEVREDKDLIGGIVVKIGDLVLDGSVRAQLEGLKESF
ncbi:MAG: ATP synthase F1 subunit delta [Desulfobacteraceae bacterium]